jgi:hypothetical protein
MAKKLVLTVLTIVMYVMLMDVLLVKISIIFQRENQQETVYVRKTMELQMKMLF